MSDEANDLAASCDHAEKWTSWDGVPVCYSCWRTCFETRNRAQEDARMSAASGGRKLLPNRVVKRL